MTLQASVGPYDFISISLNEKAPWYVIPFDKHGNCTGPKTRDHLLEAVKQGDFTDIYIFSHGWNNDWSDAVGDNPSGGPSGGGYRGMIESYVNLRRTHKLAYNRPYRPLLIGIFWPSAWLILPWESAPRIAAADPQIAAAAQAQERHALDDVAQLLDEGDVEAFYAYAQQDKLSADDARKLAHILLPVYNLGVDSGPSDVPRPAGQVTADQLVELWRKIGGRAKPRDTGTRGARLGRVSATPEVAGQLESFDPRSLLRGASVWMMKDRAGTVGAHGVADLLTGLLGASATARVHAIGHSFGCRVLLSAICFPPSLPRKVDSLLLLQPAVSHLCFASEIASTGKPGGYRAALERVDQPILLTFSNEDQPLHNFFHLALVRASDVGDAQIAGGDEPPNIYAALGGYGPRGVAAGECETIPINPVGQPYKLGADAPEIYALNGAGVIHGHGDFNQEATWWALYNQVAR
jgi:pimeloyl-ACP methyl ester carboxylesterase